MKKETNYYKIATILLVTVILIGSVGYFFNKTQENYYLQGVQFGQTNAVNIILSEVVNNGFVTIPTEQGNVTLITSNTINIARENVLLEIVNSVNENGYVTISDSESELFLVPVPQQEN